MDLTKILKAGNKIYSPLIGDCIVVNIYKNPQICIKVRSTEGCDFTFDKEGRYFPMISECLLFPSKENRDWSTWKTNKECPFKPFDKVLVRDDNSLEWACGHFSHLCDKYCVSGLYWNQCIPYNQETQHLVGTNQDCPDKYKIW